MIYIYIPVNATFKIYEIPGNDMRPLICLEYSKSFEMICNIVNIFCICCKFSIFYVSLINLTVF
jgi:hypothetical protein